MTNSFSIEKFKCLILLVVASLLFGFNNFIFSWFVYFPVFLLVYVSGIKTVWIYGGIYGVLSYIIYLPWLLKFSSVAMAGVSLLYFVFCSILFLVLKLFSVKNKVLRFIFFLAVICLYEYLKTLGFVGFSYGVNGYNQWKNLYLIQIADFTGVWGVSFILNYFSVLLFSLAVDYVEQKRISYSNIVFSFTGIVLVLLCFGYGIVKVNVVNGRDSVLETKKIAAVQNNSDPWKGDFNSYVKDVRKLMELTDSLLESDSDVDIVVWPETAVVPSILSNYYQGVDSRRKELIDYLLEYLNSKSCAFVIGNFNATETDDFNSAYFFEPRVNVLPPEPESYSKIHLVPFTEYFPYGKQFPWLYKMLLDGDTHLWTPGNEYKVFSYKGLKFSTPICFEDNFGRDCKKFVKAGAGAFVNLSNDAWSKSYRCQIQHLQMAVFRSVENHVPTVRSTASGQTCMIDSTGKVRVMSRPFEENFIVAEIPILK